MILGKIRIQNFRSIIDTGDVYLSKSYLINILAGQNESGKTAFLKALHFFEDGEYEEDDRRIGTHPRVDCTFYLTDEEYEELKNVTNKKVADYFKQNGFSFVRGSTKDDDFDSLKHIASDDLKLVVNEFNDSLKSNSGEESEQENEDTDDNIEEFNAYNYFNSIRPKFVFYSSFVDSILPGKIKYGELPSNQAVQDFEQVYGVNFQELLSTSTTDQQREDTQEKIRKKASDSLNSYWKQVISGEQVEYKYIISIKNNSTQPNDGYINFFVKQGTEAPLKISQKSQGFQWFSGFILRLRAHQNNIEEEGIVLLIDEPGQGLHEQAQEDVKNVIEELASKSNMQIIYSTHQPILIGKEDLQFSRLLLVDKTDSEGSKFKNISQFMTSNGNRDALAPIKSALGLVSINKLSNTKLNVVVEGVTEYFYFKTVFSDEYSIIPSSGVDDTKNIFSILFGWGLKAKVIVDDDTQGRKVYNKMKKKLFNNSDDEIKNVVLKSNVDGIENLLSENIINNILKKFGYTFDNASTKVKNVEKVGKMIFAKSFFDEYKDDMSKLDTETKNNFDKVKDFLDLE